MLDSHGQEARLLELVHAVGQESRREHDQESSGDREEVAEIETTRAAIESAPSSTAATLPSTLPTAVTPGEVVSVIAKRNSAVSHPSRTTAKNTRPARPEAG